MLKFSNASIHALHDSRRLQFFAQSLQDGFAHGCGVHGLGQDLKREHIVIAIDNEAGQKISFAEDDAVGVGIRDEFLAVGDGGTNALRDQRRQIGHRAVEIMRIAICDDEL